MSTKKENIFEWIKDKRNIGMEIDSRALFLQMIDSSLLQNYKTEIFS